MFYNWRDVNREDVVYLLEKLKSFFADESNWVFWPIAVDDNNIEVDPMVPNARRWSLMGASQKFSTEKFGLPLANYVDCATRDFLNDLSDDLLIKGLSYQDEYALICLGHEFLLKEAKTNV